MIEADFMLIPVEWHCLYYSSALGKKRTGAGGSLMEAEFHADREYQRFLTLESRIWILFSVIIWVECENRTQISKVVNSSLSTYYIIIFKIQPFIDAKLDYSCDTDRRL